ncbi:MAG TPA: YlxR family protein [Symbiobacteriaceae bacterium]|nr:YlxR family protein [Symbiobacteriaceae bacterium]
MSSGSAGVRLKKVPQRQCVGCGEMKSKKELLRIVRTPEGSVEFDTSQAGKKPGRGAYLCPDRECLAKAVKRKGLERALQHAVSDEVWKVLDAKLPTVGTVGEG